MARKEFPLVPPGKIATVFPVFIGLALPLAIAAILFYVGKDVHALRDAATALFILPVVAGILAWSMHARHVDLEDGHLVLRRFPWPKRVALSELDLTQARVANLDEERALQPAMKIAGSGLPGYRTGWFRLRGKRTAWVLLTDWRRVLVLPKRDGGLFLLSPERPDALLDALHRAGG